MREANRNEFAAVAIAGCGAICAVGLGTDSLRSAMRANTSGLRSCPRFGHSRFQSSVAGEAPLNGTHGNDDPAWNLAGQALQEARDEGSGVLRSIPPEHVGLVLATTKANLEALERLADGRPCSDAARRHLRPELLAADLAEAYGAKGPVQCVSLACISGLVAIQQGVKLIQRGSADAVLVVGVDHLSAFVVAGFSALKALDPAGCRPFERDRRGLSPGEAGAAMLLARADTVARPAVVVRGWATSNDANHMTGPSRDGSGLALAIRAALDAAGLRPGDIQFVNAHGTGTSYNDAMEIQALRSVFGADCPPFNGFKGMLGHTLGAAGVLETILCVQAMNDKFLPGTPRLMTPAEAAPPSLNREPRAVPELDRVLKLNVGFGGVNAALVLVHE